MSSSRRRDDSMPATGAGLIRYFKEETHGPKLSPKIVMAFTIGVIVFEIALHIYSPL